VVVAGAELFTGNVLLVIAWASRRIGGLEMGRSWTIALVYHLVYRRRWPDPDRPPGGSRPLDKRPTGG
jgi:hypothetical protein